MHAERKIKKSGEDVTGRKSPRIAAHLARRRPGLLTYTRSGSDAVGRADEKRLRAIEHAMDGRARRALGPRRPRVGLA